MHVARVFGLSRIRFYENGVVSLNLPISEQAVGARATRTTHPQVLNGFAELFSLLIQQPFAVENPFLWRTRAEVVNIIGDTGCGDLIRHSISCMHTHEQTIDKPHCGLCSQCVGRRFATLASRYADKDPANIYKIDLLEGEREMDKDLTLVESFIRTATDMKDMTDVKVIERYGEVGRVLRHVPPLTSNEVAENIVRLHRKHASEVTEVTEVTEVIDNAIKAHSTEIRERRLPRTCAIIMAVSEGYKSDDKRPASKSKDLLVANAELQPRKGQAVWMSRYSPNDDKVYRLIGENNFSFLTNEEIGRRFTQSIRSQLGRDITPEALRACLNRVRRHHRLPKSWYVQKNAVND
jgi:hypothetical protein